MSVHVESWAWDQDLKPAHKLLLVKLAQMANDDGLVSMPLSQDELARQVGTRRETINKTLDAMRGAAMIQYDSARGAAKTYQLLVPWADGGVRKTHRIDREPVRKSHNSGVTETHTLGKGPDSSQMQSTAETAEESGAEGLSTESTAPTTATNLNHKTKTVDQKLNLKTLPAIAGSPDWLGQRRWRITSSRENQGPYVVDLARDTCTCENRYPTPCRHKREAEAAEQHANVARKMELRNAVWDEVVAIFGPSTKRGELERGRIVSDLAELLAHEQIAELPAQWGAEIRRRYDALAGEWGVSRTTLDAFLRNWGVAGNVANDVQAGGKSSAYAGDLERFERATGTNI